MSDYLRKKSSHSKSNYFGQNLQICFMNEIQNEDLNDDEVFPEFTDSNFEDESNNGAQIKDISPRTTSYHISNLPAFSFKPNYTCDDLLAQHYKQQTEVKQALYNVPKNVKFQMKVEHEENVNNKKPSPIADIVGLSTYGLERLTYEDILEMNIGQLQVIANDLCNQIESI